MERTNRSPAEVMAAARKHLSNLGWSHPWGADADHHKTAEDAKRSAAAGFTFFTIDPSGFVANDADRMTEADLLRATQQQYNDGIWDSAAWEETFLRRSFDVGVMSLRFTREQLLRAAVKYARALNHTAEVARAIRAECVNRPFEIEVSVDETDAITSPLDHLFVGLELKRRNVPNVVSVAPRFVGEFEKGIDYRGDRAEFERQLVEHVAVARFCGPYKISVHSGSDKFSIYPTIGRICGDLLHLKTAGTSYLEALRVVARTAPHLFAEICAFCRSRFEADRKSYHLSTTQAEVNSLPPFSRDPAGEALYLDERAGRQLLHVTFGSVLTSGRDAKGRPFKEGILEMLDKHPELHLEFLEKHFDKHLLALNKG